MKKLIAYSSQGGNTKKLAEAIFKQLPGETEIKTMDEVGSIDGYDVVCAGFWFKAGQPDPTAQQFLKKCSSGKLFLFATHGVAADSDHARMGMNKAREIAAGATIVGTFNCPGEVPRKVQENAANKDPQPPWLADASAAKGHPDENDLYTLMEALEAANLLEKLPTRKKGMFN